MLGRVRDCPIRYTWAIFGQDDSSGRWLSGEATHAVYILYIGILIGYTLWHHLYHHYSGDQQGNKNTT